MELSILRKIAKRLMMASGLMKRTSLPWVVSEENPVDSHPLDDFRLFAIIGTWFEEDVIEATVKNAFIQGCERVYIIDNNSPDNTVKKAISAGAILAESFVTESYDEDLRIKLMNQTVLNISKNENMKHIWWLWLDADEFPHGPLGLTIRQYLQQLDRRFRIVGARNFNHFPDEPPHYVSGYHPLDFQPLCEEFTAFEFDHCDLGHWKHPLQRYDKDGGLITSEAGFHRVKPSSMPLIEPVQPIFLHHFPYREKDRTFSRLRHLCEKDEHGKVRNKLNDSRVGGATGITKRFKGLENIYLKRWEKVENLHTIGNPLGVQPQPWKDLVETEHAVFKAWYPPE